MSRAFVLKNRFRPLAGRSAVELIELALNLLSRLVVLVEKLGSAV